MLAAPSGEELKQLKKAVAIMTTAEKAEAANLTDEQIQKIAADADIDAGIFAIFINGYALENANAKTRNAKDDTNRRGRKGRRGGMLFKQQN